MSKNILAEIVNTRRAFLSRVGYEQGAQIPAKRKVPLHNFPCGNLICEVKRKSPSRGAFTTSESTMSTNNEFFIDSLVNTYINAGVQSISVLTEHSYFGGSLDDLIRIKKTHPKLCVLRKDFLLYEEEIDVSYRAGADAVLLMASVLNDESLRTLYRKTQELGLAALVEVHSEAEAVRVFESITPKIVGINCRNLSTFVLDKITPLRIIRYIARKYKTAPPFYVYESAVFHASDVRFARESGCSAALIGEAAVTHSQRIHSWSCALKTDVVKVTDEHWFWNSILTRMAQESQNKRMPLVKICGLCRKDDVRAALDLGVDILGFVLATESRRKTTVSFIQEMQETQLIPRTVLTVGVVVGMPTEVQISLVKSGALHALQIHTPQNASESIDYNEISVPWYRAVSLKNEAHVELAHKSGSPRTLVDAYSDTHIGGSGQRVDDVLLQRLRQHMPLWLAGGLRPENIASVVDTHLPELVDVASGVEDAPGVKNHAKLRAFVTHAKTERCKF